MDNITKDVFIETTIEENEWVTILEQKLSGLPELPGVYLYMDTLGKVIYVGKAKILKNRVRSYFQQRDDKGAKTEWLVENIRSLDYIVTKTETEALILENTLIKQHKPQYNILLKDDKAYPWLRIDMNENFPRLEIVRRVQKDGARYFTAFISATSLREALDPVRRLFPVRTCKRDIKENDKQRPCLYFHIGLCTAPCSGNITSAEYVQNVKDMCRFLEGKHEEVMDHLTKQMNDYAEMLMFEKAASMRDRITNLKALSRKQAVVSDKMEERDIIGFAGDEYHRATSILSVRNGKLVSNRSFVLEGTGSFTKSEMMEAVLMQYYQEDTLIPKEFLLEAEPDFLEAVTDWLSSKKGSKVSIHVPQRGFKTELIDMAQKNAFEELEQYKRVVLGRQKENYLAVEHLGRLLGLPAAPDIIEAYDISNTGNSEMVASMVVFRKGTSDRALYRRFKIRNQSVQDDYASMQQTLRRRFQRFQNKTDDSAFGQLPDLILTDGGIGHVHSVEFVLQELHLSIPVWGMAKDDKHKSHQLVSDRGEISLARHTDILRLVASIQNEAHRFAISYNRQLGRKRQVESELDGISGIGGKRKKALIKAFGSVAGIKRATIEDIAGIEGFGEKRAKALKGAFGTKVSKK